MEVLAEEEEEEGLSSNILTASVMIKDANGIVIHERQAQAPAEEGGGGDWRKARVSSTRSGRSSVTSTVARSSMTSAAARTSATSHARQGRDTPPLLTSTSAVLVTETT